MPLKRSRRRGRDTGWTGPLWCNTPAMRMVRGDLGWTSHYDKPVIEVLRFRLKWTLVLLVPAATVSIGAGGLLGLLAGWRSGKRADRILTALLLLLHSVPSYCLGILLLLLLSIHAPFFPSGGMMSGPLSGLAGLADLLHHMGLPFSALVLCGAASHFLVMRSAVRQVSAKDYVLTALSLGLSDRRVLLRHMLPNALPPLVNMAALEFGFMVGGALLVEMVFSWQGMGTLIHDAVLSRDYPLLSGCLFVLTLCVIAANGLADLACAAVDPRVRDDPADV